MSSRRIRKCRFRNFLVITINLVQSSQNISLTNNVIFVKFSLMNTFRLWKFPKIIEKHFFKQIFFIEKISLQLCKHLKIPSFSPYASIKPHFCEGKSFFSWDFYLRSATSVSTFRWRFLSLTSSHWMYMRHCSSHRLTNRLPNSGFISLKKEILPLNLWKSYSLSKMYDKNSWDGHHRSCQIYYFTWVVLCVPYRKEENLKKAS